jgi:hypothetical protein
MICTVSLLPVQTSRRRWAGGTSGTSWANLTLRPGRTSGANITLRASGARGTNITVGAGRTRGTNVTLGARGTGGADGTDVTLGAGRASGANITLRASGANVTLGAGRTSGTNVTLRAGRTRCQLDLVDCRLELGRAHSAKDWTAADATPDQQQHEQNHRPDQAGQHFLRPPGCFHAVSSSFLRRITSPTTGPAARGINTGPGPCSAA